MPLGGWDRGIKYQVPLHKQPYPTHIKQAFTLDSQTLMTKTKTQKLRRKLEREAAEKKANKKKSAPKNTPKGGRKGKAQGYISDVVLPAAKAAIKQVALAAAKAGVSKAVPYAARAGNMALDRLRKFATSEEQYLYGFTDPENAAPGPGDAQYSTFVARHRGYTDMTISDLPNDTHTGLNYKMLAVPPWQFDSPGVLNSADNTGVYTDDKAYRGTNTNPITFVACPHIPRAMAGFKSSGIPDDNGVQPFVSRFVQGFQCSNLLFGQGAYSNSWHEADATLSTNENSWMKPLKNYDMEFFNTRAVNEATQKAPNATDIVETASTHLVRHRLVGLKIAVECNSPALTVTGQVVGGDNRQLYGVMSEIVRRDNTGGSLITANSTTTDVIADYGLDPSEEVFTGRTFAQSRRDLGALSHGARYESVFIPASDHVLGWSTIPAAKAAFSGPTESATESVTPQVNGGWNLDTAHFAYQRLADMCLNIPMAYITVSGAPVGTTFRVYTTCAIEYVVLNDSPLALVREAARMQKRFQPDWGELAVLPSACCGSCGTAARAVTTAPALKHGAAAAAGFLLRETGRKVDTEMYTIGAGNAVSVMASQMKSVLSNNSDAHVAGPLTKLGDVAAAPPLRSVQHTHAVM